MTNTPESLNSPVVNTPVSLDALVVITLGSLDCLVKNKPGINFLVYKEQASEQVYKKKLLVTNRPRSKDPQMY